MRKTNETFFAHQRTNDGKGFTIAFRADPDTNTIVFAKAQCSERDNFSKRIGRDVAEGRLNAHKRIGAIAGDIDVKNLNPGEVAKLLLNHPTVVRM